VVLQLGLGGGAKQVFAVKSSMLRNVTQGLGTWADCFGRPVERKMGMSFETGCVWSLCRAGSLETVASVFAR